MKNNNYTKLIITLLLSLFYLSGTSQAISAFEIMFDNKSDEISKDNIEDFYSLILNLHSDFNSYNQSKNNYVTKYNKVIQENSRKNEINDILNCMKNNLKIEQSIDKGEKFLNLTTFIVSKNNGIIDLNDYQIEILKSNIKINRSNSFNSLGKFDYSALKTSKTIESELDYKFKLEDKCNSKIEIEILLKAYTNFAYKIISKNDINKEFIIGLEKYKLIAFKKNYIALETLNSKNIEIYPYQKGMIADAKSTMIFPIYKSIFKYIISTITIDIEQLKKDFPIEKLRELNKFGVYSIIKMPENTIDEEVLITKKEFRTLNISKEIN